MQSIFHALLLVLITFVTGALSILRFYETDAGVTARRLAGELAELADTRTDSRNHSRLLETVSLIDIDEISHLSFIMKLTQAKKKDNFPYGQVHLFADAEPPVSGLLALSTEHANGDCSLHRRDCHAWLSSDGTRRFACHSKPTTKSLTSDASPSWVWRAFISSEAKRKTVERKRINFVHNSSTIISWMQLVGLLSSVTVPCDAPVARGMSLPLARGTTAEHLLLKQLRNSLIIHSPVVL